MQAVHHSGNLPAGYQSRALILSWGIPVMRTPQKVLVVKINRRVIPAAVTTVAAEHPPGGMKFAVRETESAD